LGGMRHNTVVICWPDSWRKSQSWQLFVGKFSVSCLVMESGWHHHDIITLQSASVWPPGGSWLLLCLRASTGSPAMKTG
jgi:hypothetical protein